MFIVVALLISSVGFSQEIGLGPKIKNSHPAKAKTPKMSLVHESSPLSLKGPEAKNTSVWSSKTSKSKVRFREEITNPKGLEAKNHKPWDDKSSIQTNSKAVYEEPKSMKPKKTWFH